MILNLTDLSDESLQSQIFRQVRAKILAGELAASEPLPSIRALARKQLISVITVQRAYETLERDGLIHSRRGKGFFVSELSDGARKSMAKNRLIERLKPQLNAALAEGLTATEIVGILKKILRNGDS